MVKHFFEHIMIMRRDSQLNGVIARGDEDSNRIEQQAYEMQKSLFAYWSVFSLRYVDNLHQRVKYNILYCLKDGLTSRITQQFMPCGGSEFSGRVRQWMEEPPRIAHLR